MLYKQSVVTLCRAISMLLLLTPSAFPAAVYTVTALTQLPSSADVESLNNNNQISGIYYNGTTDAAFEANALTFTPEGVPSGLTAVDFSVINDDGLLGGYGSPGSGFEAFVGSSVVPLAGNQDSFGYALNDSGQLAGYVITPGNEYAVIMTTSGTSVQTSAEIFQGINGAGIATGFNGFSELVYGTAAGVTVVPLSAGFSEMLGGGINSSGNICGIGYTSSSGYYQGFYYNGTSSVAIPLPIGETSSQLSTGCINALNQVVGYAYGGASEVGFIWSPSTGTQILNSLVPANWTITNALYVNNNGTILAQGTNGTYTGYVLLATPEPSTLWLTGLILFLPVLHRSRRNRRSNVG